jgi:cytidyltransferase-like protein
MAHLSEDLDLTFNEIVSILSKVASGEIKNATEKVDGQNLFLSWTINSDGEVRIADDADGGEARTARNRGDILRGGMSTEEYISKWKGHPAENAFTNGFKAVSAALRKLSPETLEDIFSNGQRYVNMEIMYPKNPNIILYSAPNIVLHGLQYFGDDETSDSRMLAKEKFRSLVKAVDGAVQEVGGENWSIYGPKIVALKKLADGSALEEVTSKIQSFASPVGMGATLGDYVSLVVTKYAEQVGLPENILEPVLMLMLDPDGAKDRGIKVTGLKKGLPKELQSVVSNLGSKTKSRKYIASVLRPLEIAISDFAIEVLRGVKSFFVDEHDEEVQRMRDELQQAIVHLKALQSSGDEKMGELVDKQLAKLGKIENLASSLEGVVFEYPPGSDRIYKLTGAFAMSNQIIGRARRTGMAEDIEEEMVLEIEDESEDPVTDIDFQDPGVVAIVPGAFKPPHMGHADMVKKYAQMADRVIILISAPTRNARKLPNGREITAEDSEKIWNLYVGSDPKIEVYQSSHASPINAAYEISGLSGARQKAAEKMGMESILEGATVILGASTKGEDASRWAGARKYVGDDLELIDPLQSAVEPLVRADGQPFSSTDMRNLLGDIAAHKEELRDFAGDNVDGLLRVLGLEALEEVTAMGGGSVEGPAGNFVGKRDDDEGYPLGGKKRKKNQNSVIRQENIDLNLVDSVVRLIMERGILQ